MHFNPLFEVGPRLPALAALVHDLETTFWRVRSEDMAPPRVETLSPQRTTKRKRQDEQDQDEEEPQAKRAASSES